MSHTSAPASLVTGAATEYAFSGRVLGRYEIDYFRCVETGFIQTEKPYWLDEAYSSAISTLDVGYICRNVTLAAELAGLIPRCLPDFECGLDFGGGYGMFVRLMRDKGFRFLRHDPMCENLFAQCFDHTDWLDQKFDLVTAFEVFEHLPDPLASVNEMFGFAPTIVFSTELQPAEGVAGIDDWWYFVPESGQHISFYNEASLRWIADHFRARVYSNGNLHLMTRDSRIVDPFHKPAERSGLVGRLLRRIAGGRPERQARESLLHADFQYVRGLVQQKNCDSAAIR